MRSQRNSQPHLTMHRRERHRSLASRRMRDISRVIAGLGLPARLARMGSGLSSLNMFRCGRGSLCPYSIVIRLWSARSPLPPLHTWMADVELIEQGMLMTLRVSQRRMPMACRPPSWSHADDLLQQASRRGRSCVAVLVALANGAAACRSTSNQPWATPG
jgi:hypothetical protein